MKILITGGTGLIGRALVDILTVKDKYIKDLLGDYTFTSLNSSICDLKDFNATLNTFSNINPSIVIHLAANVGGLYRNMENKIEMFEDNILINTNVLKVCHTLNINRVISCLSTCIYPDDILEKDETLCEEMLHLGPPHISNEGFSYAKRMLELHSRLYRECFNRQYTCIIPTNIFGPGDNFSIENGHVISALIHKAYIASKNNLPLDILGDGSAKRQFIYNYDVAKIIIELINKPEVYLINISPSKTYSIKNVAKKIASLFNIDDIKFDATKSNGQKSKTVNTNLLNKTLNTKLTELDDALYQTVNWFKQNYDNCRK